MNLPLSLVLKLLGSHKWLWSLLWCLRLPESLLSSCADLPSTLLLGWLWLFLGTCAGSGFVIRVASPFLTFDILACSSVWWLFGLTSLASDGLGDAVAIDEGGGGVSL